MNLASRTILSYALIQHLTPLPIAVATQNPTFLMAAAALHQDQPTVAAETPRLEWPSWLVHINGAQMTIKQGVDQSKRNYLQSTYYTREPMTKIHTFYLDLLKANEYPGVTGGLQTGNTMSGVTQNASGHLEADNYPDGQPGPHTQIRINFSRFELNAPIRVMITVTAHPYIRYGPEPIRRSKLPPLPTTPNPKSQEASDQQERKATEHMEKYDNPVAPRKGPPVPGLAWPQWLVHIEGQPLKIQKPVNLSTMTSFTSSYTTNMDSDSIRAFYADLLTYNGYSVDPIYSNPPPRPRGESAADRMGSVKGVWYPSGSPGPRIEILVQFRPLNFHQSDLPVKVDLRVSGFPAEP